jgi:hypothetical protein
MSHPKEVKRRKGRLWHLEDQKLTLTEARALQKHLKRTEEKKATKNNTPSGYQVWWSK